MRRVSSCIGVGLFCTAATAFYVCVRVAYFGVDYGSLSLSHTQGARTNLTILLFPPVTGKAPTALNYQLPIPTLHLHPNLCHPWSGGADQTNPAGADTLYMMRHISHLRWYKIHVGGTSREKSRSSFFSLFSFHHDQPPLRV